MEKIDLSVIFLLVTDYLIEPFNHEQGIDIAKFYGVVEYTESTHEKIVQIAGIIEKI